MPSQHSNDLPASGDAIVAGCTTCTLSRRHFVSASVLSVMGALLGACGDGESSATAPGPTPGTTVGATRSGNVWSIDIAAATDLSTRGLLILAGGAKPALVVRSGNDSYVAYDAACPHAGTVFSWQSIGNSVRCNNHGSEFVSATGALSRGPATTGLARLPITRSGNKLTVNVG